MSSPFVIDFINKASSERQNSELVFGYTVLMKGLYQTKRGY